MDAIRIGLISTGCRFIIMVMQFMLIVRVDWMLIGYCRCVLRGGCYPDAEIPAA